MGLQPKQAVQATLFDDTAAQEKSEKLMHVMDSVNRRMGKGSMAIAASGSKQRWTIQPSLFCTWVVMVSWSFFSGSRLPLRSTSLPIEIRPSTGGVIASPLIMLLLLF
jgi:hypothetical protein